MSWLQTGGVVLLKIVSTETIPEDKRADLLRAASKLLRAGSVNKVLITNTGKLVASYRLYRLGQALHGRGFDQRQSAAAVNAMK